MNNMEDRNTSTIKVEVTGTKLDKVQQQFDDQVGISELRTVLQKIKGLMDDKDIIKYAEHLDILSLHEILDDVFGGVEDMSECLGKLFGFLCPKEDKPRLNIDLDEISFVAGVGLLLNILNSEIETLKNDFKTLMDALDIPQGEEISPADLIKRAAAKIKTANPPPKDE